MFFLGQEATEPALPWQCYSFTRRTRKRTKDSRIEISPDCFASDSATVDGLGSYPCQPKQTIWLRLVTRSNKNGKEACILNVGTVIYDDNCLYNHSQRNNVVIEFGALSSFRTELHIGSGVVCVVCPFASAGNEKLKTFMLI